MDFKKITANRGLSVILLVLVLISSLVLINLLNTNRNFDNDRLTSKSYYGSLTIENQPPDIGINIFFNGFGFINGTMNFSNETFSYEGEYACLGDDVQFSFTTEENSFQFTFLGNLLANDSIITGDVRFYESANDTYDGTFYLSLI